MSAKPTRVTLVGSSGLDLLSGGSGLTVFTLPSQATAAYSDSATNADAVVALSAAAAGNANFLSGVGWSYSDDPTAGALTVMSVDRTLLSVDITRAGPGFLSFPRPMMGYAESDVTVTLTAGGSGVVGKINVIGVGTVAGGAEWTPLPPSAPAGVTRAFAAYPDYCMSDASHLVPCADGDQVRWIQDIVSGTWYEQATPANRFIMRNAGVGKWYWETSGSPRNHTVGACFSAGGFVGVAVSHNGTGGSVGLGVGGSGSGGCGLGAYNGNWTGLLPNFVNVGGVSNGDLAARRLIGDMRGTGNAFFFDGAAAGTSGNTSVNWGNLCIGELLQGGGLSWNGRIYGACWGTAALSVATIDAWLDSLFP